MVIWVEAMVVVMMDGEQGSLGVDATVGLTTGMREARSRIQTKRCGRLDLMQRNNITCELMGVTVYWMCVYIKWL